MPKVELAKYQMNQPVRLNCPIPANFYLSYLKNGDYGILLSVEVNEIIAHVIFDRYPNRPISVFKEHLDFL